ncbi:GCN5-related N-acetyltransferase [Lenzites betulinus]|nr:GCN5-related N-acetyltransferase [Lenzites betulinus]
MATSFPDIRQISAEATVPLRHSILWPSHPVSHVLLPEDQIGRHYGAFLSTSWAEPVAVISIFYDPIPAPGGDHIPTPTNVGAKVTIPRVARIRKFACATEHQGKGIGTSLLEAACIVAAREMECVVVWCDARQSASGWYERRGMHKFGDIFYKGDIEYVRMMREL